MGHKKTEARDESTFKSLMSLSNLIKIVGGTESAHPNTGRSFATNRAKSGSYLSGLLYCKSLFVVFTAMHLHFIQKDFGFKLHLLLDYFMEALISN